MFKSNLFLMCLVVLVLAACETVNVYPTKVVEVQGPVTVEKTVEIETKIDCASIDPSFEQQGDTCVSICVACLQGGGQCLDTNKNGYGDTCVGPAPVECFKVKYAYDHDRDGHGDPNSTWKIACEGLTDPAWVLVGDDCNDDDASVHPGVDEYCDGIDNNCDGATDTQLGQENTVCVAVGQCNLKYKDKVGQLCTGSFGVCAVTGIIECVPGKAAPVCSSDVDGADSKAVPEVCGDSLDNDCDGVTDNGCAPKVDPSEVDADNDGYKALVDCNDNDASVYPGLGSCPVIKGLTKESFKLVVVFGQTKSDWPYDDGFFYQLGNTSNDLSFSKDKAYLTWSTTSFAHDTFTAIDLDPAQSLIAFNAVEYPGKKKICSGTVIDKIELKLSLPNVYVVKNGVWTKVNEQVELLEANDLSVISSPLPYGGNGYPAPQVLCMAMLKL